MSNLTYRDKTQTDTSDTGEDIREVTNGELLSQAVLNRPASNLKRRTESIKDYLKDETYLSRALQSRNVSLIEVAADGSIAAPGMIKIVKQGDCYYPIPGHIRGDEASKDYRILITSGVDGMSTYCVKKTAIETYYTDSNDAQYNPDLGLCNAGDTISLRVPRLSAAEVSSSDRDLVTSDSQAKAFKDAVIGDSLSDFLNGGDVLDSNSTGVLVKSPRDNLLKIVFQQSATDLAGLEAYLSQAVVTSLVIEANGSTYTMDHRSLEYSNSTLYLYRENYLPIDEADLSSGVTIRAEDPTTFTSTFVSGEVTLTLESGVADPYSELIPLFYHTGDRIVIAGVGSVLKSHIDNIHSLGFPVLITGDGRVVSTYTEGQVSRLSFQIKVEVPNDAQNYTEYSVEKQLLYDPTLVDSGYTVDSIELLEVSNTPDPDSELKIEYVQSDNTTTTAFDTGDIMSLGDVVGGIVRTPSTGRDTPIIGSGDRLRFKLYKSLGNLPAGERLLCRVNLVERIQYS